MKTITKSKVTAIVIASMCLLLGSVANAGPLDKVDMCHKPGKKNQKIINISLEKDGEKHFGHGDYVTGPEVCDGIDNECDKPLTIDDDPVDLYNVTVGVGACAVTASQSCEGGEKIDPLPGIPSEEVCDDGIDNDCDGVVDEGCDPEPVVCVCEGVWNNGYGAEPLTSVVPSEWPRIFSAGTNSSGELNVYGGTPTPQGYGFASYSYGMYCYDHDSSYVQFEQWTIDHRSGDGVASCSALLQSYAAD